MIVRLLCDFSFHQRLDQMRLKATRDEEVARESAREADGFVKLVFHFEDLHRDGGKIYWLKTIRGQAKSFDVINDGVIRGKQLQGVKKCA